MKSAVQIALWLWFGFSAMMWVGAIMREETPWKIAAIHSGDWLVKTVLIAATLGRGAVVLEKAGFGDCATFVCPLFFWRPASAAVQDPIRRIRKMTRRGLSTTFP